jgi:hypothetical protein
MAHVIPVPGRKERWTKLEFNKRFRCPFGRAMRRPKGPGEGQRVLERTPASQFFMGDFRDK